jgi:hypothetical protein
MSGKPRWACAMCGMYSSRRYSVKRHVANLHNGLSYVISFIDYVAGTRQGVYFPNPIPSYLTKQQFQSQTTAAPRPTDILKEELLRSAIRKRFGQY